jgi:hypothetical protein
MDADWRASWIAGRLRIEADKPDPECPVVEKGAAISLTAEQAVELRRIIDAGLENLNP